MQQVKNQPATREIWVWSLGWEDFLEEGMVTHSSILAWRIPRTTIHSVAKSQTQLKWLSTHKHIRTMRSEVRTLQQIEPAVRWHGAAPSLGKTSEPAKTSPAAPQRLHFRCDAEGQDRGAGLWLPICPNTQQLSERDTSHPSSRSYTAMLEERKGFWGSIIHGSPSIRQKRIKNLTTLGRVSPESEVSTPSFAS